MKLARKLAVDLDTLVDLDEAERTVAQIWYGREDDLDTYGVPFGEWAPVVFARLAPRPGGIGWIRDALIRNAEVMIYTTSLVESLPEAERWLKDWLNRPFTVIHQLTDPGQLGAQVYIVPQGCEYDIPNHPRVVEMPVSGHFDRLLVGRYLDVESPPPSAGDLLSEDAGNLPEADGAEEDDEAE